MLPNFLICGAMKAGTTSLYHYLRQHPQICMSWEKEVGYFAGNYDKGLEWYEQHFPDCSGKQVIGEACPQYISDPRVPERVASLIPNAKLFFLLRNPVDRAYSHYLFDISLGKGSTSSFSETIRTESGYRRYVKRGFYHMQLERFLRVFDREQLHIILSEEMRQNTLSVVQRCYEFLGVDVLFVPDISVRHNVTGAPRNYVAYRLLQTLVGLRNIAWPLVSVPLKRRATPIYNRVRSALITSRDERLSMLEQDRRDLSEIYRPHNERLSLLLGRDLTEVWT